MGILRTHKKMLRNWAYTSLAKFIKAQDSKTEKFVVVHAVAFSFPEQLVVVYNPTKKQMVRLARFEANSLFHVAMYTQYFTASVALMLLLFPPFLKHYSLLHNLFLFCVLIFPTIWLLLKHRKRRIAFLSKLEHTRIPRAQLSLKDSLRLPAIKILNWNFFAYFLSVYLMGLWPLLGLLQTKSIFYSALWPVEYHNHLIMQGCKVDGKIIPPPKRLPAQK